MRVTRGIRPQRRMCVPTRYDAKAMRICVLTDDYPPYSRGGAGKVAASVVREYGARGHEVVVITTVQDRTKAGSEQDGGVRVERLYSEYPERWRAWKCLYNRQVVRALEALLGEIKPEVVHAHNVHAHLSYHALRVAQRSGARVLLTLHDCMAFHYGKFTEYIDHSDLSVPKRFNYAVSVWRQVTTYKRRYNPLRNVVIRWYLTRVDVVCAVSYALRDALAANRITADAVVHNGVDVAEWDEWAKLVVGDDRSADFVSRPVVGFVGKTSGVKGAYQALEAFARVQALVPEAVFKVIGASALEAGAERRAHDLGIIDRVVCSGWITGPELVAAYRSCAVVVFPSVCLDTFGMVNVEAMLTGLPVVTTCFGGSPEVVVDGVTGAVVNPLNVERFAEAVSGLLTDPARAQQWGAAGRRRAEKEFTLARQVDQYLALMQA